MSVYRARAAVGAVGLVLVLLAAACRPGRRVGTVVSTPPPLPTAAPHQNPSGLGAAAIVIRTQPPEATPTATPTPTPIVGERLDARLAETIACDFETLLELAATPSTYDEFRGIPGADCRAFEGGEITDPPAALPCYTCVVRLAEATGRYDFFPDAAGEVATLQQAQITSPWLDAGGDGRGSDVASSLRLAVDALVTASCPSAAVADVENPGGVLGVKHPSVRRLRGELWTLSSPRAPAWRAARRWETGADLLVRYWGLADEEGEPLRVGVVWRRAPLTVVEEAWEADDPPYRRGPDFGPRGWRLGEQVFHRERLYPLQAYEACREAGMVECDEGRLGIEQTDQQRMAVPLDEAVAALSRVTDPMASPALVFWADQLAVAWGLASRQGNALGKRDALAAAGLGFDWTYCGEANELRRNLLQRLALERQDTRWGQLAFQAMSWRGWAVTGDCGGGGGGWQGDKVIERGEAFLRAHPDSPVRDEITFHVARAYEAWWALSHRQPDDYLDPASFRPGADEARRKAIAYYRLYLDRSGTLPDLQRTWLRQKLFRLEHGLDTWQWFYYCICD